MKTRIYNILATVISAAISAILTVSLLFGVPSIPSAPTTELNGEPSALYTITDLSEKNYLKYAYYTPDEFIVPGSYPASGEIVDLEKHSRPATRGTYQFLILNIDPAAEDFYEKSEALSTFLTDDNYWHFTLRIPVCMSACCVYVKSVLTARSGAISDYNFIDYSEKQGYSEKHVSATEPLMLDLRFYTRREAIIPTTEARAMIITIHYESGENKPAGLANVPIIGLDSSVRKINYVDKTILTVVALSAGFILAILIFASCLKRSLFMLPQALLSAGICGFSALVFSILSANKAPYLIFTSLPVFLIITVVAAVLSLAYAIKSRKTEFFIAPPIVFTFAIVFFCPKPILPAFATPSMWLLIAALGVTAFSTFRFFAELEQRNKYLTDNLQSEVDYRTKELSSIIDERERLLRYLSHDMRKPISSVKRFINEISKNEEDPENLKALEIIGQKINGIEDSLSELGKFSKSGFSAEERKATDMAKFLYTVYKTLQPDCEANGIVLACDASRVSAFIKREALYSVINNLIFNAIEHAECKNIEVAAGKTKGACKITVSDDGNGIKSENDVFLPYVSESENSENLGLGLYICKQHILSMGGELIYERKNGKTVFTITLPLA